MSNKKLAILSGSVLALSLLVSGSALAASNDSAEGHGNAGWRENGIVHMNSKARPAVVGTVSTINGNSISLSARNGSTYTVDASNAAVLKNNTTSTISNIAVGDMLNVQGTLSGTSVVATRIMDIANGKFNNRGRGNASSTVGFQGNGEPVVAGKVSSVNGLTFVIANSSNVSYTIDATNAKIQKAGNTSSTISNVAVGDNVIVQGTVNGTSITAASVIDQTNATVNANDKGAQTHTNFFGSIGNFFKHLFGF